MDMLVMLSRLEAAIDSTYVGSVGSMETMYGGGGVGKK